MTDTIELTARIHWYSGSKYEQQEHDATVDPKKRRSTPISVPDGMMLHARVTDAHQQGNERQGILATLKFDDNRAPLDIYELRTLHPHPETGEQFGLDIIPGKRRAIITYQAAPETGTQLDVSA